MSQKLNQVVAVEKGIKSRTCSAISNLHKVNQRTELFTGFSKTYKPKNETDEALPTENKKVQKIATEVLDEFIINFTGLLDITATKDWANCISKADVMVDNEVLIKDAPIPYLLFLEKQILDIRTYVDNLPTLETSEDWVKDVNSGLFKTEPVATHRTKKVQKPIVLYEATDRHPAQTQMITEDIPVGYWNTVKHSGAIQIPMKKKLLEKIDKLACAVKYAREQANSTEAESVEVGKKIFEYLLR